MGILESTEKSLYPNGQLRWERITDRFGTDFEEKDFYETGSLKTLIQENNQKSEKSTYYANGKKESDSFLNKKTQEAITTTYNEMGQKSAYIIETPTHKQEKCFYPNGKLLSEMTLDKRTGKSIGTGFSQTGVKNVEWDETPEQSITISYTDGKKEREVIKNNQMSEEITRLYSEKGLLEKEFYNSFQKKVEKITSFDITGHKESIHLSDRQAGLRTSQRYYSDGQLKSDYSLNNNNQHKIYKEYYPDGSLKSEEQDTPEMSVQMTYNQTGQKKVEKKEDKKTGEKITLQYDSNGLLKKTIHETKGLEKQVYYAENGVMNKETVWDKKTNKMKEIDALGNVMHIRDRKDPINEFIFNAFSKNETLKKAGTDITETDFSNSKSITLKKNQNQQA